MAVNHRIPTRAGNLYHTDVAAQYARNTDDDTAIRRPRNIKPWAILITTTIITLGCIIMWNTVVTPWWQGIQDQWNYGSSRITQMDADVSHGGESHFIAQYDKGAIVIIEIPFSRVDSTRVYTIAGIAGDDSTPVVLLSTTRDTQTGRLDLVIQVEGTNFQTVLFNTGTTFSQEQK